MMRALWTAGVGMKAQQMNVDVISNNLANVNTTGYKKERLEFKDMMYQTLQRASVLNGEGRPINLQVGHGVAAVATVKNFGIGNLERTDNPMDMAIEGDGFFTIKGVNEDVVYTRDGSFKVSVTEMGNKITTSDGLALLDDNGNEIYLNVDTDVINISNGGEIRYYDNEMGMMMELGQTVGVVKFKNPQGLESIGNNFFKKNTASGEPIRIQDSDSKPTLKQYFIESSNVQIVEEMVKLIVAQRAYEINSKSIQSADEMLGMANNLKR